MSDLSKIPFPSWYLSPTEYVVYSNKQDKDIYIENVDVDVVCFGSEGLVVNSVHNAIQMCLEILGSRLTPYPVIMPITAPSSVISAVLRAGAQPVILDIDENTFQISKKDLADFLAGYSECIVIHYCPNQDYVLDPELLELTKDNITIGLIEDLPFPKVLKSYKGKLTFLVGDYLPVTQAAYIANVPEQQVKDLKTVRDNTLGLHAEPTLLHQREVLGFHLNMDAYKDLTDLNLARTREVIRVKDAVRMCRKLNTESCVAIKTIDPLHHKPELKDRWPEGIPDYPVADRLANSYITVPAAPGNPTQFKKFLTKIEELNEQEEE